STALDLSKTSQNRKRREEEHAVLPDEKSSSPVEVSAQAEAARAARAALGQLPQEEREAVSLCCEQDLTRQNASEILGIPERTLADRVQRGLEKLRVRLAAQGFASITVLAIGESLRGVPQTPLGLGNAVQKICASAAKS